jgi:hypothetical protein
MWVAGSSETSYPLTKEHGVNSLKTIIFILTAVRVYISRFCAENPRYLDPPSIDVFNLHICLYEKHLRVSKPE